MTFLPSPRRARISTFGWVLALAALVSLAAAPPAKAAYAASKDICAGDPATTNPNTCTPVAIVGVGQPVFYVIKVTNPFGSPPSTISLTEANTGANAPWPAGFVPSANAVVCKDQTGAPVTVVGTAIGSFSLPLNTTVTCTVAGAFASAVGTVVNHTDVDDKTTTTQVTAPVKVVTTTPLGADLAMTKFVSPNAVGAGTAFPLPANVTYTFVIKNLGPVAVDVGPWFKLHDAMALIPGSVPLKATFVSASCSSAPATTQCLSTNPTLTSTSPLIGTMAPHPMFDWGFTPPLSGPYGHIDVGGTITLTVVYKIEKIAGLSCVKVPGGSDGTDNTGFFTLTDPSTSTAKYDPNNANNTSSAILAVHTGGTVVDPDCGDGQLSIKKVQVSPTPVTNPVAWNPPTTSGTVVYDVTITNNSVPAQTITIPGSQMQDYVINGIGTPPFTRTFVAMTCYATNQAGLCGFLNPNIGTPPPPAPFPSPLTQFKYTYYGQPNLGWQGIAAKPVTLAPGKFVTLRISFNYSYPDCDTVPAVSPKTIGNRFDVTYMASAVGASSPTPQNVQYHQSANATTYMQPQQACKFKVTKSLVGGPNVRFGVPLVYHVNFTNNDASRVIGTTLDAVRITDAAYPQLPFTATYACDAIPLGSVTPLPAPGTVPAPGTAIFTNSPSQGAPIFQFANLHYDSGATLHCKITILVARPTYGNQLCSALPTDFEQMGLLDVTNPYNSNLIWPPSGTYPGGATNPAPQNKNWATVRAPLPECFDALVHKTASSRGLSPAWTWAPNGPPVDYAISVTNTTNNGTLTGSGATVPGWNGLLATDRITSVPPGVPYHLDDVLAGPPAICVPAAWCVPLGPPPAQPSQSHAGVASLAAGVTGIWNLELTPNPVPFHAGSTIRNCATLTPFGTLAGAHYYSNFDLAAPPSSCTDVPVLQTKTLSVVKTVTNETGMAFPLPPLSFDVGTAPNQSNPLSSCGPYPIPVQGSTLATPASLSLANGGSVSSPPWNVANVPMGDTCAIIETPPTSVPSTAMRVCAAQGGTAYWDTIVTPSPITIGAGPNNQVVVTNVLRCKISKASLSVIKTFVNATGSPSIFGPLAFDATVTCGPVAVTSNLTLTTPATATTGTSPAGVVPGISVGDSCTVTETAPPPPALALRWCGAHGGAPIWNTTIASSPVSPPSTVQITNTLSCLDVQQTKLTITKEFADSGPGVLMPSGSLFTIDTNCTAQPSAPASVTIASGQAGTVLVPVGESCSPTETPPPIPPGADRWCSSHGAAGTAHWLIAVAPMPPVVITAAGPNVVHVKNQLICEYRNIQGQLSVTKTVDPDPMSFGGALIFQISAACTNPTANYPFNVHGNTSTVPMTVPLGSQCQFSEGRFPPLPAGCTWLRPQFSPQPLTIGPGLNQEMVSNGYTCLPQQGGTQTR
jgi:Domain of unknown function (DUF5979)